MKLFFAKEKEKKQKEKKKMVDIKWILTIVVLAFLIAMCFSFISESLISKVPIYISMIIVLAVIFIGVIFDMVGVAVTVADPKVFNSMAAKKVKCAKTALILIKNNAKVSSICNDVVGDICGIISGSGGAIITTMLVKQLGGIPAIIPSLLITALISSLTIGGKAVGKGIAVTKANFIIEKFSKVLFMVR